MPTLIRSGQRFLHIPSGVVQARSARVRGGGGMPSLLNEMVEYWDLDEASGVRAGKHAGLDLTDNNTVTQGDGVGVGQKAAAFAAVNSEYLSHPGNADLRGSIAGPWSRCGWVWIDNASAHFISCETSVGNAVIRGSGQLRSRFRHSTSVIQISHGALSLGAWHFVYWGLRADGVTCEGSLDNGTIGTGTLPSAYVPGTTNALDFGRQSGSAAYLDGRIQAVGFWSRLLTAGERAWLYNSGTAARLYADI